VEIDLPELLVGRSVRELTLAGEIQVVAITRHGRAMIPSLGSEFRAGDLVHLALLASSAGRLKHLLGLQ
jgi:trk system potassium uptake protein TrkA